MPDLKNAGGFVSIRHKLRRMRVRFPPEYYRMNSESDWTEDSRGFEAMIDRQLHNPALSFLEVLVVEGLYVVDVGSKYESNPTKYVQLTSILISLAHSVKFSAKNSCNMTI